MQMESRLGVGAGPPPVSCVTDVLVSFFYQSVAAFLFLADLADRPSY